MIYAYIVCLIVSTIFTMHSETEGAKLINIIAVALNAMAIGYNLHGAI